MIYTAYEMARDCQAGLPQGWRHFVRQYVPVMRKLLAHYGGGEDLLVGILARAREPQSALLAALEPAPERVLVASLRQILLAELSPATVEIEVSLAEVGAAFEPLSVTEKQAAWLETMRYGLEDAGAMLRMAPATVRKVRERAAELLRGSLDNWRLSLLGDCGLQLGRAAAEAAGKDCPPAKIFLDVLDGRAGWRGREELERHAAGCWACVDRFCRLAEAIELLRGVEPLPETAMSGYLKLLGVVEKRKGWRALLGGAAS